MSWQIITTVRSGQGISAYLPVSYLLVSLSPCLSALHGAPHVRYRDGSDRTGGNRGCNRERLALRAEHGAGGLPSLRKLAHHTRALRKQALAEMDDLLRQLSAQRPNLKYDLEVYLSNEPSLTTPVDSILVRMAVAVMEERMGFSTRPFARGEGNASNDTNTFRRHGIPAIKCGPNARTEPNGAEMNRLNGTHVAKDDIAQSARFYIQMACELSGRTRAEINDGL